ncbi:MAG: chromosome segregation protein SMC [Anaerolineae bacterium]|nr:chromosome segregation protein SMC [Anaerolineae bacterium]
MPSRLKSLELHGFKTFASRTVFEFSAGITAIVGPNGSGKSNIADALRWVLGEQSYSLLRAKKTEDMIFAGSDNRTRAGMASATVIFDNTDNWLPLEFSEVSMGRRAYRDGRNDYVLNGQHVRLRDINELLSQSGLSERTYTILGQGLVDASLTLKADDRRKLFEEAAGVSLYRNRREETLRRLDNTKRNLERILDIKTELEPRIKTLERQSRRAHEYKNLQNDLHSLLREWYGYHWHKAQREMAESRKVQHKQEAHQNEARKGYKEVQEKYSTFRARIGALRLQLNGWNRESLELRTEREEVSRELAVLDERDRSLQTSRQALKADLDRSTDDRSLLKERLADAEGDTARVNTDFKEANARFEAAKETLNTQKADRSGVEEKMRTTQEKVARMHSRRAETQARLDELSERQRTQSERIELATQNITAAKNEFNDAKEIHNSAKVKNKKAEKTFQSVEKDVETRKSEIAKLDEKRRNTTENLAAQNAEKSSLLAKLEVLEGAEDSLSGYTDGARFLLDAARQAMLNGTRGALSASLEVPAELEIAISASLGEHLDAVLIENGNLDEALSLLESDEAGRAALLPLDGQLKVATINAPKDDDCLGCASDLVGAPAELKPAIDILLGQVLVVRDRVAARRLIAGQAPHVKVVTLRGEVFRGDGLVLAGKSSRGATLSRPRQRRELQESLKSLDIGLNEIDSALQTLTSKLLVEQKALGKAETTLRDSRTAFENSQSAEREAAVTLESANRQLEWGQKQLEELQAEASRAEADITELSNTEAQIESESTQSQEKLRSLNLQLSKLVLDESQEQVTYWTTRAAVAEQTLDGAKARLVERQKQFNGLEEGQRVLSERMKEIDFQITDLVQKKKSLHEQEGSLETKIGQLRKKIEPAEKELVTAETQESELQNQDSNAQRGMTSADRLYNQVQVDVIRRQEAIETLRNRIQDDFGLVTLEYQSDVSGPNPLPMEGWVEQLPVLTEIMPDVEEQMKRLRTQLRRMGPVNPEAQSEFDTETERYEFMKTQIDDLHKAQLDLEKVIAELDELTKKEFKKTFEAVDKEFRQIFVRLFDGGSARLTLTDSQDLVNTGIDIEARLPGRREQGLAMLSGGERSLTAIALIFALLKISPTPLCVMDEVDAMLDEANIGRFSELLKELSKETQFIIITHNRNTVQAADVIYGVTMNRASASQIISLRLDEVTDKYVGRS